MKRKMKHQRHDARFSEASGNGLDTCEKCPAAYQFCYVADQIGHSFDVRIMRLVSDKIV